VLDWYNDIGITRPIVISIGYRHVMRDARIVKAAVSVSKECQPVLLCISDGGSYKYPSRNRAEARTRAA
jgi:hypothetical protein